MVVNGKTFIVDSSFVLASLLPDEEKILPKAAFDQFVLGKISLVSTVLLPFEVINGVKMSVVRKRINENEATELTDRFLKLKLELLNVDFKEALILSIKEELTIYDASYLWLAREKDYPLLSLDKHLQKFTAKQNFN